VVAPALSAWIERGSPPAMTDSRLRDLIKEAEEADEEEGDLDVDRLLAEARSSASTKR
jgi:hypothetical protein